MRFKVDIFTAFNFKKTLTIEKREILCSFTKTRFDGKDMHNNYNPKSNDQIWLRKKYECNNYIGSKTNPQ